MNDFEYTYYRAPDGATYRIHLEPDQDAESPRGCGVDLATLITFGGRYFSPDKDTDHDFPMRYIDRGYTSSVDMRRVCKYAALFMPEVLAVTGLQRSGYDGNLSTTDDDDAEGIAFVTKAAWDSNMGADYASPVVVQGNLTPAEAIEQEVRQYNTWVSGEYVGYVIENYRTGEDVDSLWGIDDADYAMQEAVGCLPEGSVEITRDEADGTDDE